MKRTLLILTTAWIGLGGGTAGQTAVASARIDSRDTLLAALGKATLDCLGTVDPSTYDTSSGALARTFGSCRDGGRAALRKVDALLAVQFSKPGTAERLAAHYVSRWNTFVESFPYGHITQCPVWMLENVIDAPTRESVPRLVAQRRIGKENYRYTVFSSQCAQDGECAVRQAAACTAGFGPAFLVDTEPRRSRVEVDPAWWLTTYEFPDDLSNPFKQPGYYHPMSYYGDPPGAVYGAIQRAGEQCSRWDPYTTMHTIDAVLTPVDCGGGWLCMTYCTIPPHKLPPYY